MTLTGNQVLGGAQRFPGTQAPVPAQGELRLVVDTAVPSAY
jgi:hypothetical protein